MIRRKTLALLLIAGAVLTFSATKASAEVESKDLAGLNFNVNVYAYPGCGYGYYTYPGCGYYPYPYYIGPYYYGAYYYPYTAPCPRRCPPPPLWVW